MPDRLSALDASFLYMDQPTTPMHVGSVSIFRKPRSGFDYDGLVDLIGARIGMVPRYRQKLRQVPGGVARPVWIDDRDFDVTYHVRRSALPAPGTDRALHDLVARLMSRSLDHTRPLWEMYLVEGLAGGRVAIITKTHQAMVDGIQSIDIGQVVLDDSPSPRAAPEDTWVARCEPPPWRLVVDAVGDRTVVMADLCLDEFTDHGHCGVLDDRGRVDNDATLERYQAAALAQAQAGAHLLGTSGMMDGQVGVVRRALDGAGRQDVVPAGPRRGAGVPARGGAGRGGGCGHGHGQARAAVPRRAPAGR